MLTLLSLFIVQQAVALRTLNTLLRGPGAKKIELPFPECLDFILLKMMRGARQSQEAGAPVSKDLFFVHVYGLACVGRLLEISSDTFLQQSLDQLTAMFSAYQSEAHAAVHCITTCISESGEKLEFGSGPDNCVVEVGCCRYACHCCYLHDATNGSDVRAAVKVSRLCRAEFVCVTISSDFDRPQQALYSSICHTSNILIYDRICHSFNN